MSIAESLFWGDRQGRAECANVGVRPGAKDTQGVLNSMQKFRPDGVERGSKPRAPSQELFALESVLNVSSTFRPTGVDTTHEKLSVTLLRKIRLLGHVNCRRARGASRRWLGPRSMRTRPWRDSSFEKKTSWHSCRTCSIASRPLRPAEPLHISGTPRSGGSSRSPLSGAHRVLKPGSKILDVGCGTGWVTWFFGWYYRGMALDVEGMDCSKPDAG